MRNLFRKSVRLVRYPAAMDMEDVIRAFRDVGEGSPFWQALDSILDSALLDAVNDVSDSKKTSEELFHCAGKVEALSLFKARIEEIKGEAKGQVGRN